METISRNKMDLQNLIPAVSYVNEAFCFEEEGRTVLEHSAAVPKETDYRGSKPKPTLTSDAKPSSLSSRVSKVPQIDRKQAETPRKRYKASRQVFLKADIARQVARMNESSEIWECLSFVCVLLLGAAGLGVFLALIQSPKTTTAAATLSTIGSSVLLLFIFVCITTLLKDGTSLHRD